MSKITIAQLLAGPANDCRNISQVVGNNSIIKYWLNSYLSKVGEKDSLMIKDRVNMKRLAEIYGEDKLKKLINFYITNYQTLTYLSGKPSVGALMVFRKRIEDSMYKDHIGQYTPDKLSCANWD